MLTSTAEIRVLPRRPDTQPEKQTKLQIRSLEDEFAISAAVKLISRGQLVAFQWGNVFGMAMDGTRSKAIQHALSVKSDSNPNRKFSGILDLKLFLSLIDKSKVHPQIVSLLENPDQLSHLTSGLFHLRAPVTSTAQGLVPPSMLSQEGGQLFLQNLDSSKHPIFKLVQACAASGINWLCCTTLNRTGQPEVVKLIEAKKFISRLPHQTISLLLTDPTPFHKTVLGSFAIVDISYHANGKLKVIRDGFLPASEFVHRILGISVDVSEAKPAAYPHADFSPLITHIDRLSLSPPAIRDLAVVYISTLMVIT